MYPFITYFFFFTVPQGMRDLSSPPGIEAMSPAVEMQSLNHWTAGEVLIVSLIFVILLPFYLFLKCPLPFHHHYASFKTVGILSSTKLSLPTPHRELTSPFFGIHCTPARLTFYCSYLIFISVS